MNKGDKMVDNCSIKLIKVGEHTVPSPLAYFMKDFNKYEKLVFHVALINAGGEKIILNTGMPADMEPLLQHWKNTDPGIKVVKFEEHNKASYFSEMGFAPDSVDHVILSPLISYATGNLGMFKNARIHFSKTGWEQIMNKNPLEIMPEREINFPDSILRSLVTDWWNKVNLLEDEDSINDYVKVIRTGGHHFSSMLIIIDTKIGKVGLTDSFFTYRNLEEHIPVGVGVDLKESINAIKIAEKKCDVIIPMLDENLMKKYPNGIIV